MSKNEHYDTGYFTSKEKKPCCVCGKLTDQIEYNYEAYLCGPKCEAFLERMCRTIRELRNWTEVTKGLYRYVVAASACYEIHIMYHAKDTDVLTANASLYIVGEWISLENDSKFFERKLLLNGSVMACLEKAAEHEEEMRG